MRSILAALLLCASLTLPVHAQVGLDGIFQGPWNPNAQRGGDYSHRGVGHYVKRSGLRATRKASRGRGVSLNGVTPALAAKAREIVSACGSTVVSAVRHTYIAGTRHMSLHASGRAVDISGNPGCIYSHLKGWPGGYSVDYASAPGGPHVHISLGGFEQGVRFSHRGKSYSAARKVKRWKKRRR